MAVEQTISIPQILLVLFLGGIAIRWIFWGSSSSRQSAGSFNAGSLRARESDVERIQQMFPQIARRTIMWDLQRNGGNVVATTERILNGRPLENPPQTFQPPMPITASASSTSTVNPKLGLAKPPQPDLISRYNLASRIAEDNETAEDADGPSNTGGKPAWSQNKSERQALLQKRREEMILAARRKMQAKVASETGYGDESVGQT